MALSFGTKMPRQVAEYLESKVGIPEVLCKAFEGKFLCIDWGTDKSRSRSRSRSRSVGGNKKLTTHAASKVGVGIARIKQE